MYVMFDPNVSFLRLGAHFPNVTNNYSAKWLLNPHSNVKMSTWFVVFMTPLTNSLASTFKYICVWQIYKCLFFCLGFSFLDLQTETKRFNQP